MSAGRADATNAGVGVPEPDRVVPYAVPARDGGGDDDDGGRGRGALLLFGDPAAPRLALLCAGFADDHTVFRPFARALAEEGRALVGVMVRVVARPSSRRVPAATRRRPVVLRLTRGAARFAGGAVPAGPRRSPGGRRPVDVPR